MLQSDLSIPDLPLLVSFQHDNKEIDDADLTVRLVAQVEKPIQREFPSKASLTSSKNLCFLESSLTKAIVLYLNFAVSCYILHLVENQLYGSLAFCFNLN